MSKQQFMTEHLREGEVYAGLILGKNGEDYHLFLMPGHVPKATWEQATLWADGIGGALPTRREQSLLFANCREHFESDWYWSCEQYSGDSGYAWVQSFSFGNQVISHKFSSNRARAVRRLPI